MATNPNTLDPSDKWYCSHSCGFEPPEAEGPYHCYDCGWAEDRPPSEEKENI
jgi:hypothetical protein